MHAHRHFLQDCPLGITPGTAATIHAIRQKEQPAQVTSVVVLVLLSCCATLAHSMRTEILLCHNSPPISVFCFKKSICWPAITPLLAQASVALRHLFRTASPLRRLPRVCSRVVSHRCSVTFPRAIGTLVSVALVLYQAGERLWPRVLIGP